MISRRGFLAGAASTVTALGWPVGVGAVARVSAPGEQAAAPTDGPRIRRIRIFSSSGAFHRFIGPNAYDERPKGITGQRRSCLIELSDGSRGLGTLGYARVDDDVLATVRELVGTDIFSFYRWDGERIVDLAPDGRRIFLDARTAWVESGVLDAIGRQLDRPVWRLFGDAARDGVDPYDGTLYFEEVARGTDDVGVVAAIGRRSREDGYRAIKVKLGRPDKWVPGEAGLHRDIDAFIALREAVGSTFNLMADANNGYRDRFEWAVTLLERCAPHGLYFMEELFPDDAAAYRRLRDRLHATHLHVPIADGENVRDMSAFDDYLEAGVYSYIQPDMPTCGFSNILRTARRTAAHPHAQLIPHVWQSQIGLLMSLHASKVERRIPFVEDSRYHEHVIDTAGYHFRAGQWFIPDAPGWGTALVPDFDRFLTDEEVVVGP